MITANEVREVQSKFNIIYNSIKNDPNTTIDLELIKFSINAHILSYVANEGVFENKQSVSIPLKNLNYDLKELETYYNDLGFQVEIQPKNDLHWITISWKECE